MTSSNETQSIDAYGAHESGTEVILFLFLAFAVGAGVRHLLKHTPLPYTVILIVIGLIIGALPKWERLEFMQDYLTIATLDPHLMLIIFLPTLIFESAFVMDVHTFKKTIVQSLTLAGPGLLLSTFLTALMAKFIFTYNWSWVVALMFGTIMSATDPVAVVALLKELGASKHLGVIIEGESLLNDGAAIVLFNVFKDELIPKQGRSALDVFVYFVQVAFGGPFFGYFMAKCTIFWLSRVYNDALVEIGITLVSTYVTFYIGEQLLKVSGVLALVTLGIEINSRKTNISPEVEVFLHRFWEVLAYLANTLIFILVGVVISQRAFQDVEAKDWIFVFTLYLGMMVIRLIVNGLLFPILTRVGYSMTWKDMVVISWGGLRGAVGLALALVVAQTSEINFDKIGCKILFHTAGIVIFTLVINATTVKYLLNALGMSDISSARCKTMSSAVTRVNEAKKRAINMLKSDRFLADANWSIVRRTTRINDPYERIDSEEFPQDSLHVKTQNNHCPQCEIEVQRLPNRKELSELAEEVRYMMIKSEKISYWRQFEQGLLSREAVRVLINLADTVLDTPDRLISINDLSPHWKIPKIFRKLRHLIKYAIEWKSSNQYHSPVSKCLKVFYIVAMNPIFEWTLFGIIVFNVLCSILELSITDSTVIFVMDILNYLFCAAYLIEALIKIVGLRLHYWKSKWHLFDFIILIVSIVDIVMKLSIPQNTSKFSPAALRAIRILRVLRVSRVLRLIKIFLPRLIKIVDHFVNRRLRFGYDIGRGFVVGEEELLQRSDRIKLVHKEVAEELLKRVEANRLNVIRSMGLIRKEHPGVALSVKTHQATRSVLNHCQEVVKQILSNGMLDEIDANKLLKEIETKIKRLENTAASLPAPDPETIFCNLRWLNGLDSEVVTSLRACANILQFDSDDHIVTQGESADGVYIILFGLVKVVCHKSIDEADEKEETIIDFYGAGTVVGEMAILSGRDIRNASIVCETDVQAFYINGTDLWQIMREKPVLETRLWRVYGIRSAIISLAKLPQYQDWPNNQLSLMCESSYIVTRQSCESSIFDITDDHTEVIVISGEVRSVSTRAILEAPCVVPKRDRQLLMNVGSPKLLVITDKMSASEEMYLTETKSQDSYKTHPIKVTPTEVLNVIKQFGVTVLTVSYSVAMRIYNLRNIISRNRVYPDDGTNTASDNGEVDGVILEDGSEDNGGIRDSGHDGAIRDSGDGAIRDSGDGAIRDSGDGGIRDSGHDGAIRDSGDGAIRDSGDGTKSRSGDGIDTENEAILNQHNDRQNNGNCEIEDIDGPSGMESDISADNSNNDIVIDNNPIMH